MARKLSSGVHTVRIKTGKGSKTRLQRVRVNAKGQWKFLKNTKSGSTKSIKTTSTRKRTTRRGNPSRKVSKMGKSKMLRTMGLVGGAEDVAWGFIGFSLMGGTVTALPMTRVVQGLAGHAFNRRGKARLVPGILDLITLWLAGGFGRNGKVRALDPLAGFVSGLRQLQKLSPLV